MCYGNETDFKEYEECKGCNGYDSNNRLCFLEPYYTDKQGNRIICPCTTCLIKVVCNKLCYELQIYYSLFGIEYSESQWSKKGI